MSLKLWVATKWYSWQGCMKKANLSQLLTTRPCGSFRSEPLTTTACAATAPYLTRLSGGSCGIGNAKLDRDSQPITWRSWCAKFKRSTDRRVSWHWWLECSEWLRSKINSWNTLNPSLDKQMDDHTGFHYHPRSRFNWCTRVNRRYITSK